MRTPRSLGTIRAPRSRFWAPQQPICGFRSLQMNRRVSFPRNHTSHLRRLLFTSTRSYSAAARQSIRASSSDQEISAITRQSDAQDMSRFFPHSDFAEDQTLSRTILWSHVLYRGFQTGATLGIGASCVHALFYRKRPFFARTLLFAGRGAMVGTALMVPAVVMRMRGRDEIEWKDRSWRILENEGQKEVDDWSLLGTAAGVAAVAVRGGGGAVRMLGAAGTGSMVGVCGYMAWRYGVHQGRR